MIDYSEDWLILLIFKIKGSVMVRASLFAIPAAILAFLLVSIDEWIPNFRTDYGFDDASKSQLWSATTGVLAILLGFRTNRAMSRFWEGTGLLHQMRGEWFDSVSCCVTFSRAAAEVKPREVLYFRHTIVRLMSLCHGSALEEIAGNTEGGSITAIDSFGLDSATLQHLRECKEKHGFNRVEVLLHLTQSIITKALDDGILKIPPPILSRVYQTLSRGFVNLLNAKKIADTRFPFPYAQIITMLLLGHVVMTPLMLSCLMTSKVMCPIFTFVPIFGMFYLNFVGVELENPFGDDDNDLPLDHFQSEMNNCLLMLLQDNADLVSTIDPMRCTMDFKILKESLQHNEDGSMPAKGHIHNRRISSFQWAEDKGDIATFSLHAAAFATKDETKDDSIVQVRSQLSDAPPPPPTVKEVKATSDQPLAVTPATSAEPQQQPGSDLTGAIFTGAIESFLEASHPQVYKKSPQGGPSQQDLNQQDFSPPIFAAAPPYGDQGFDTPRIFDSQNPIPDPSRMFDSPNPTPDRSKAGLPMIVPKTTRLQELVSNKRDQSSPVKGHLVKTHMKGAAVAMSNQLDQGVQQSMGDFKEALDNWTQLIEGQLTELRQNVAALRRFSDTIPELLEVGHAHS